ncbi:hypothetical protein ACTXGQ_18815 [Marinobacter sp. 1Y8]
MRLTLFFIIGLALTGCASVGGSGISGNAIEVTGVDDELADEIEVSSLGFSRPFMGVVTVGTADPFFRAYIGKEQMRLESMQLYVIASSADWMYWDEVRFRMGDSLVKIPMSRIGTDVQCGQYGCAHFEDIVGSVFVEHLEYISSQEAPVTLRLNSSRVGGYLDMQISPKEAQTFLSELRNTTDQGD